ncbi:hypothetical protein F2Q68_00046585, partial [Brassica cretica]
MRLNNNLNGYSHHRLVTDIPATTGTAFGEFFFFVKRNSPSRIDIVPINRKTNCLCTSVAPKVQWRQRFNTREFSEIYNLGLPVAAVYFN